MRSLDTSLVEDKIYEMARYAGVNITSSCRQALQAAYDAETSPACSFALGKLIENSEVAREMEMPVCQDCGMAIAILEIGQDVHLEGRPLAEAVNSAVRRAYEDGYFRKSVCDPLTRVNTGDNTPAAIHTEIVPGDKVRITYLPKGFGSENMSKLYMLKPAQGTEGILEAIVQTVKEAGSRPCPPVFVGVGIGGSFDTCAYLAKKAITRDIGTHNPRLDVAAIETEALERINTLHIGCQGFHGDVSAIGVNCEIAPTHIAGLPVAVNIQCHCVRCEKATL